MRVSAWLFLPLKDESEDKDALDAAVKALEETSMEGMQTSEAIPKPSKYPKYHAHLAAPSMRKPSQTHRQQFVS